MPLYFTIVVKKKYMFFNKRNIQVEKEKKNNEIKYRVFSIIKILNYSSNRFSPVGDLKQLLSVRRKCTPCPARGVEGVCKP